MSQITDYVNRVQDEIKNILDESGAVIANSHLVLTSGQHSDGYINLRKLAGRADYMEAIGHVTSAIIQTDVREKGYIHDEVLLVGPETMGRSFAQAASCYAYWGDHTDLDHVWCEPNADKSAMQWNSKLNFKDQIADKHCYIIDDVLTTARTIKQTIDLIRASGGTVDGVIVVVQRNLSITAADLDVPLLVALYEVNLQNHNPEDCPYCRERRPMMLHPGHGHEWINAHPDYPTTE